MAVLSLLTPVLIPDLHDLAMMLRSDCVILNDVNPFSRKSRVHRCKIRTATRTRWLHVPIHPSDRRVPLYQVRLQPGSSWIGNWIRTLRLNYRNSPYFNFYEPEIRTDLEKAAATGLLIEAVALLWQRLFTYLYIDVQWLWAHDLESYDPDPDQLCKNRACDRLWQEHDSRPYMRQSTHHKPMSFEHPVYNQHFGGFEPWCCLLDVLFQFGPMAWQLLDTLQRSREEQK